MTRRHLSFPCGDDTLVGTLDDAAMSDPRVATGLLIVSGGNELRAGAFRSQALLASSIAAAGYPVFRFDRRGVGDSTGHNDGYLGSEADIAAALAAFRAARPGLVRIVGFGNCDAASALMLSAGAGFDALVLANPWTFEDDAGHAVPPEAIRARYWEKLRNPREVLRLLSGGVALGKLLRGLTQAARAPQPKSPLARRMEHGLAQFPGPATILLAGRDRTAQAFLSTWDRSDPRLQTCAGADHAFSAPEDQDWLRQRLLARLSAQEQARQLDMG